MKMVFDMSTGKVLEDSQAVQSRTCHELSFAYPRAELRLQETTLSSSEETRIPLELVIADLNAFLLKMS